MTHTPQKLHDEPPTEEENKNNLNVVAHFYSQKDKQKETDFIKKIITGSDLDTVVTFCLQNSKKKLAILEHTLNSMGTLNRIHETSFPYQFKDDATGHVSKTDYKLIAVKKKR